MKCTQCGNTDLVRTCPPFVLANSMTPIESFVCKSCGHYEFFLVGKEARATIPDQAKNDMEDLRQLRLDLDALQNKPKE